MKNLYYFSKEKLQFVEIKNLKLKAILFSTTSLIVLSLIILGAGNLFFSYGNYQSEHESLKNKVNEILTLYKDLSVELDSITSNNNSLRIAANLRPISNEEMLVGVGGGSFDNSVDFLTINPDLKIDEAINLVEEVSRKISFEKSQFIEISEQLKQNKELSNCLPAIRPCKGELSSSGFGIRMHPILHRIKMHEGIDFVVDKGTSIHTTGNGVVEYAGYNGGYGLSVVINHGFGYKTIYAHLSKIKVKKRSKVSRGDVIALSGNTGLSTGAHLHYEIEHNGKKLNPEHFLFNDFNYYTSITN